MNPTQASEYCSLRYSVVSSQIQAAATAPIQRRELAIARRLAKAVATPEEASFDSARLLRPQRKGRAVRSSPQT